MILFFDTETTGLPEFVRPLDDDRQPHLVQIACLLTDDDGTERASTNLIVNPGVPIPEGAARVHGITDAIADRCGVPSSTAVAMWNKLAERADLIVAHNIKFDITLMKIAWARQFGADGPAYEKRHGNRAQFCTMERSSPIVNLPPTARMLAAGFNKPKPPKLEEAILHFFQETLEGAHDALVDVRACARVYFHMKNNGLTP
jgi:DNA polymerase III subunit epsilon